MTSSAILSSPPFVFRASRRISDCQLVFQDEKRKKGERLEGEESED